MGISESGSIIPTAEIRSRCPLSTINDLYALAFLEADIHIFPEQKSPCCRASKACQVITSSSGASIDLNKLCYCKMSFQLAGCSFSHSHIARSLGYNFLVTRHFLATSAPEMSTISNIAHHCQIRHSIPLKI